MTRCPYAHPRLWHFFKACFFFQREVLILSTATKHSRVRLAVTRSAWLNRVRTVQTNHVSGEQLGSQDTIEG